MIAAGEENYTERCAACHGDEGSGNGPDAPADINDFTDLETMLQVSQVDLLEAYNASDQHVDLTNQSENEERQGIKTAHRDIREKKQWEEYADQ